MGLDKYTKDMATAFANNEAEHHSFKIGSNPWKKAFKNYCDEATETMSIGRNPYMMNPSVQSLKPFFPEIFSKPGVSGQLAKNYVGEEMDEKTVEQRLMSGITNMVKLFEAGRMGSKTKAKGKYGKMANNEMSDFQLPKKTEGMSTEEYQRRSQEVLRRWVTRDLLTTLMIESLLPFFLMTRDDVEQIFKGINLEGGTIKDYQEGGEKSLRSQMIKGIHGIIGKKMTKVNFRKIIFGDSVI